jgi:predicted acylesterase/phospholipase RssA
MGAHLRERFQRPGPKRILSLDGGGSRGLLTLGFLQKLETHLEQRSGNPDFRLSQYFDLIGGTSTGAIIATTLALGWKVHQTVDLYFQLLPAIFEKPQVPGPLRVLIPAFKNKALTEALNEHLGDRTLASEDLRTGLAIHAKRIDSGSAWILVNNPDWCYFESPDKIGIPNSEFYLRDLVQGSAAAPTYFADVRIPLARNKRGGIASYAHFFDGGVSPNNNPAQQLLLTATDPAFGFNWKTGENELLIWSVGTGYVRKRFEKKSRKRRSSAQSIGDFRRLAYSSKVMAALEGYNHDICQQQITTMQTLSRPRFPWYVNSEVRMQTQTPLLSREPIMTFQRYDARLEIDEPEFRRPEHIESLLGQEMSANEVAKLRKLDIKERALLDVLYTAGQALGDAQLIHRDSRDEQNPVRGQAIAADWPPPAFDLPQWRREAPAPAAAEAPAAQPSGDSPPPA